VLRGNDLEDLTAPRNAVRTIGADLGQCCPPVYTTGAAVAAAETNFLSCVSRQRIGPHQLANSCGTTRGWPTNLYPAACNAVQEGQFYSRKQSFEI